MNHGILLAHGGTFSPAAQRTLAEIGHHRLRLCTSLPPAQTERGQARPIVAPAKPSA
jgi:hypothetical protein